LILLGRLKVSLSISFFLFITILLGCTVTFTKVLTLYLCCVHLPPSFSFILPPLKIKIICQVLFQF
jgi:hypothetical protein